MTLYKARSYFLKLPNLERVHFCLGNIAYLRYLVSLLPGSGTFLTRGKPRWRIHDCLFDMITWFLYQMTSSSHVIYHGFDISCFTFICPRFKVHLFRLCGVAGRGFHVDNTVAYSVSKDFIHWTLFISQILMNVRWNRAQITASVKTHLAVLIVLVNPVFQAKVAQVRIIMAYFI